MIEVEVKIPIENIEKIKINHSENFKKDDTFFYDVPIVIYYHTFK